MSALPLSLLVAVTALFAFHFTVWGEKRGDADDQQRKPTDSVSSRMTPEEMEQELVEIRKELKQLKDENKQKVGVIWVLLVLFINLFLLFSWMFEHDCLNTCCFGCLILMCLVFRICICSAQLSTFHMERRSRNTLLIILVVPSDLVLPKMISVMRRNLA